MKRLKDSDVLVAGAGPVGMVTALCLAREGLSVRILEQASGPASHSYALALHPATLELLDELGVAAPLMESALKIDSVGFFEASERKAGLDYSDLDRRYPFIAVVQQELLERHLSAALRQVGVDVLWDHRLGRVEQSADGVDVEVDEIENRYTGYAFAHMDRMVAKRRKLRVPFVIGADGHGSLVRLQSGIGFEETGATEHYAVFEFDSDAEPKGDMRLGMGPESTDVYWPLPYGQRRWSFQLTDYEVSAFSREKDRMLAHIEGGGYPLLDTEHLSEFLRERAPWFDRERIGAFRWRIAVRFDKRLAERFGEGRVWLVGDAAHMTSPAGVQSMNCGFREANHLAARIAALNRGADFQEAERFHTRFRSEWRLLQGLGSDVEPSSETDPWVASNLSRIVSSIPASGEDLRVLLRQLAIELPAP